MSLEADLLAIFSDSASPEPQSGGCREAILTLNSLVNTGKDLNPVLATLLNEEWGLIKSIRHYRRGKWPIAKQLLRLLLPITEHAGNLLASFTKQILVLCEDLDSDQNMIKAVLFGCELFTQLVNQVPWSIQPAHVIPNFFVRYLRYLTMWNPSFKNTDYSKFFDLIELMVVNFCEDLKSSPALKQLWDVILKKLPMGTLDANPNAKLMITLKNHDRPNDEQCEKLYLFFKSTVDDSQTTISNSREAVLNLFPDCMTLFTTQLMRDFDFWHKSYLSYFANVTNDSSPSQHPVAEFHHEIFSLELPPTEEMLTYFSEYLMNRMLHNTLLPYDSVCIIKWSCYIRSFSSFHEVDALLDKVTQFLLSSFWPGFETCTYVACVLCAFNLMRMDSSLARKYSNVMTGVLVNVTANYQNGSDYILNNFQVCLTNLISDGRLDTFQRIVSLTLLKMIGKNPFDSEFWLQFFKNSLDQNGLFLRSMVYGVDPNSFDFMKMKGFEIILETIMFLCNQLKFDSIQQKSKDIVTYDSQMVLDSPGDVGLFMKLVQVLNDIQGSVSSELYLEWFPSLVYQTVKLCTAHPFTVPLARLLSLFLRYKSGDFRPTLMVDMSSMQHQLGLNEKFIENCFTYSQECSGDLQKAYIYIVLSLPCSVLHYHHEAFLPFLRVTFLVAKNDAKLGEDAISTFRKWVLHFGKDFMYDIIVDVMPILSTLTKVGPGRRRSNRQSNDKNMQKEIFLLLGVLELEFIEKFFSSFRPEISRGNCLIIKMSFGNLSYDLNMSTPLPEILILATQGLNSEERLRSCELLNVITRYIIGKCGCVEGGNEKSLAQTFKIVLARVFELAHDCKPEIKRLFSPLVTQCANLFSRKISCEEMNRAFIEVLFERLMLPSGEKIMLQCCNFLNHLVKTTSAENVQKFNVEVIMNCIRRYIFSVESVERRGAAIALRSIIESLMSQSWSYDKYFFLVIYLAITCLSSYPSVYIMEVLDEIGKRLLTDTIVLYQQSDARVVPPGFFLTNVGTMSSWLLEHATSFNTLITKECAKLMSHLTTLDHVVGGLIERLESILPHLVVQVDEDFKNLVKNNHLDCLLTLYALCLEKQELDNIDDWSFSANEKVIAAVEWVLQSCDLQQPVLDILSINVFEAHGFHELQSFDDMIFAAIKITLFHQQHSDPEAIDPFVCVDLDAIYFKFLCHPSKLMIVGYDTKPYHDLSTKIWNFVTANENLATKFMETATGEIGALIHHLQSLELGSEGDASYARSNREMIDWIRRTDISQVCPAWREIVGPSIELWINSLWQACNSRNMSDHKFQTSVPYFTHLLEFVFSLMPPEAVFRKLFELLPQAQNRVYSAFEPIWLEQIRKGSDYLNWWIVQMERDMKILPQILNKYDTACQGDGFPTAVKDALDIFLMNEADWCDGFFKKQRMFELVCSLGNSFSSPPGCLVGTTMEILMNNWVREENGQIYMRLIPFLSLAARDELMNTDLVRSILTACLFSGHYNLVPWCIAKVSSSWDSLISVLEMIVSLFPSFRATTQQEVLGEVYSCAQKLEPPIHDQFFDAFFQLIDLATLSARKKFYSLNWEAMRACIFETDLMFSADTEWCNEKLMKLSMDLVLAARMYVVFEKTELFGEGGIMNMGEEDGGNFIRSLIKRCYKMQTVELGNTLSHIYPMVWQQSQCYALNSLIVLICDTKLVGKVLKHLIFHDFKGESAHHVLNSIVYNYNPPIFITWDEARNLKNHRKKVVDTGIKNSLKLRKPRYLESYSNVSVKTISQDCKAFDFINQQTPHVPDDHMSTVVEVTLEGDLIDRHMCLPYMCSLLYKTYECGLIPTVAGETIPDWMNSFIKLLLDVKTCGSAKCMIVKIIYRCQEVLKPVWSFWYLPVLHALSSGYCGDGNTHFFYQVTKMLITWDQPRKTEGDASLELRSWGRVVKLLLGGISKANDARHLLRLLRWIVEFRCDLQPPYGILMRILTSSSLLDASLEAYVILFENNIIPYEDENCLNDIFGIFQNMKEEDIREKQARVIGYLLKSATNPKIKKQHYDEVTNNLKKLSETDKGKFIKQLSEMTLSFPQIGEGFFPTILSFLEDPKRKIYHTSCLAVLDNIVTHSTTPELFGRLKKSKFFCILSSDYLNSSALIRGMKIISCFVSLGVRDIDCYISTFLKERIDGSDSKAIPREAKLEMYRLAVATFKSTGVEFREWLFERFFMEKSLAILENIVSHVADHLTRIDCPRDATLMLLEAMAKTPFCHHASWCLLSAILGRSLLFYRPENTIVDSHSYVINENEADGLLEVDLPSPGESVVEFGAGLASIEVEDLEAPPSARSVDLRPELSQFGRSQKLPNTAISYHEVLLRVKGLCKNTSKAINSAFTSVFNSIFSTPLKPSQTQRLANICETICKGFLRIQMDDTLPSFLLKLCYENSINLPPTLLKDVCGSYELEELGVLITETKLSTPLRETARNVTLTTGKENIDHHLSLYMHHGNLGLEEVFNCHKVLFPDLGPYSGGLSSTFSKETSRNAMAATSSWDLLEESLDPVYEKPDLFSMRHDLGYRILCETNQKIIKGDSKVLDKNLSKWLNADKNKKSPFEHRFQCDKSMLYFLEDDMDEFVANSNMNIANWTYRNALYGNFHVYRHGTTTKKILDNYTMAVAISDPQDRGSAFYSQLSSDTLYFPADPIQWNQLITNREHFLSYLKKNNGEDENQSNNKDHIQYLRVTYLKYLLDKGKLSEARSYAQLYSRESDWNSSLEASIISLAESYSQQNPQHDLDRAMRSWDIIAPKLTASLPNLLVQNHSVEVCDKLLCCMKSNVHVDTTKILDTIAETLGNQVVSSLMDQAMSDFDRVTHSTNFLYNRIIDEIKAMPPRSLKSAHMLADAHYRYAKFNLKHRNDVSFNCRHQISIEAVKGALSYLATSASPDMVMFLRALEVAVEDASEDMKLEFGKMIYLIPLLQLEVLLPQIMGYYALDARSAPFLEPVIDYFMANSPELVLLHTLPYVEHDGVGIDIIHRLQSRRSDTKTVRRSMLFLKFVEALNTLCSPRAVLKDYLVRMVNAETEEKMRELRTEMVNKCSYPNAENVSGILYRDNNAYLGAWLDEIWNMKMNNVPLNDILREINQHLGNTELTEQVYDLEEFSPFLKRFDPLQIEFPVPVHSSRKHLTLVKIYPQVRVYGTLRQPIEVKVLASDGCDYKLIFKYGDNLRQDQIAQLAFSVMNTAFKKRPDWDQKCESIITYSVLPLSSRFGIIEKLEPTIPLTQVLKNSEDSLDWRFQVLSRQREWLEDLQRENPIMKDGIPHKELRTAFHIASVCDETQLSRAFDDRVKDIPPNLIRTCLLNYSDSMRDYFYKKSNFLRSHAVLSFSHWIMGVGDRHLGNFLMDEKTCRLVGIDFGYAFGEKMEYLNSPEFIPFRITPQIESFYGPLYIEGILRSTMRRCFSSIDGNDLELIMRILKLFPLTSSSTSNSNREGDLASLQNKYTRLIEMLKGKLTLENPVTIIERYVRAAPVMYDDEVKEVFCRLLQRVEVPAEFSSIDDVISALISLSTDKGILTILPSSFEQWI